MDPSTSSSAASEAIPPSIPQQRPTPLRPRAHSPASAALIRIKNRRKRYLDLHPEYFSSNLELADPLAYDRLIRRFQTAAEREAEGRKKGYSGVLEADLWRSEAKIAALSNNASTTRYRRGADGEILEEEPDEVPRDKEEGIQRWRQLMELRFLKGEDTDFEYAAVDEGEEWDDLDAERLEAEDRWFEEEEERWIDDKKEGETGVQDF